jgi:hypothetical protein
MPLMLLTYNSNRRMHCTVPIVAAFVIIADLRRINAFGLSGLDASEDTV